VDFRPSEDQAAFAGRGRSEEGLALWLPSLSDSLRVAHPPPTGRVVERSPKLIGMDTASPGDLVKVDDGSAGLDGIVFDRPSSSKVIVAVVDPGRGPLFRTVHPNALTEREQESPHDRTLRLLVRRTPAPHAGARGATSGRQQRAGYTRSPTHRSTGR
jgi:hypothetical protein